MPATPHVKSSLPSAWNGVPELFRARIGEAAGRQRAMATDGHLLLVLHSPPGLNDDRRDGRFFWRDAAGNWKATNGTGAQALRQHLQEFATRLDQLDEQFESAASARDYFELLQAIARLHRSTRNLHAALQQARELIPNDRELLSIRDRAGELERSAELLHTDAKNGMDYTLARNSEELAKRSDAMLVSAHRLNLLAALFFPLATVSAIFGMNLVHGWEHDSSTHAFWIVLIAGFICGLMLMALIAWHGERGTAGKVVPDENLEKSTRN
jgi:hypothetical protein